LSQCGVGRHEASHLAASSGALVRGMVVACQLHFPKVGRPRASLETAFGKIFPTDQWGSQ
jgi:hypothetical protein